MVVWFRFWKALKDQTFAVLRQRSRFGLEADIFRAPEKTVSLAQDFVLAGKRVIDGLAGNARCLRDIAHRRLGVPIAREHASGGFDDMIRFLAHLSRLTDTRNDVN